MASHLPAPKPKPFWPAAITILFIAFFFRFYRLADHPLGIYFDPAINGLDAIRLMQRGGLTPFFPTNGGRESLEMYLLIPFLWLFDTTPFAYRVATATFSLLTVPLLFAFIYNTLPPHYALRTTHHVSRVTLAALAGLALATSYWHITVSRLFVRNILAPMLAIPVFWFYLKGWHSGQRRWFIGSGLLLGLAGYTYTVTRLLPIILVITLLPEFFFLLRAKETRLLKEQTINLILTALTALLIYLPMASYLMTHPGQLTARSGSVMVWHFLETTPEIVAELGRNTLRVAAFFCCQGSPNILFGLPGYPGSALILVPFLLLGLIIALKNWRNLCLRLIALWWLIGLLPAIISIEAPHPLRMILAIPPTASLIALGLFQLTIINEQLSKRFASPLLRRLATSLPFLILLIPVPGLFRAYFVTWPTETDVAGAYDYSAMAIRKEILAQSEKDIPIYLPLSRFNDSSLLFYLSGHFEREAKLTVPIAENAMVIAPDSNMGDAVWVRLFQNKATILPPLTAEGQQLIQAALEADQAQTIITPASGDTAARLANLSIDPAQFLSQPTLPVEAAFGPVRLIGANYVPVITPLTQVPVTLFWQADAVMRDEVEVLLRLVNDNRQAVGNGDGRPTDWVYPTTFWQPGLDTVAAQHNIVLEQQPLEPGRYWLEVAVFDPALNRRWPLTTGTSTAPDTFFMGPLKVPLPPSATNLAALLTPQPATFGEVARLIGVNLTPAAARPGAAIQLDLGWEVQDTPALDYTVFVHLLDGAGNLVVGSDSQPLAGRYPTSIWSNGERLLDHHSLTLPADIPPGQYRVAIGLYHQPSGQRLPVLLPNGQEAPDGRLILATSLVVTEPQ